MALPRLAYFGLMVSPTRYNPRLADYADRAGAYVFRSVRTGKVLYVGSCRTTKHGLRAEVQRHVQRWKSRDRENTKHDPGYHISRFAVEVAMVPCAPSKALQLEAALIQKLRPIHNTEVYDAAGKLVPF